MKKITNTTILILWVLTLNWGIAFWSVDISDNISSSVNIVNTNVWDSLSWLDNLWADITNSVMWSMEGLNEGMDALDKTMEDLDTQMEKMMEWFETWEDNFDDMMNDFDIKLEQSLELMWQRIESMMDWMMEELDIELEKMEKDLEKLWDELPTKIVWVLDTKLDNYFNRMETKTSGDKEYVEKLVKLTDKVNKLEESWKIESDLLKNAVDYIWTKAELNKQEVVVNNILDTKNKEIKEISQDDLESLKWLFDLLEVE